MNIESGGLRKYTWGALVVFHAVPVNMRIVRYIFMLTLQSILLMEPKYFLFTFWSLPLLLLSSLCLFHIRSSFQRGSNTLVLESNYLFIRNYYISKLSRS